MKLVYFLFLSFIFFSAALQSACASAFHQSRKSRSDSIPASASKRVYTTMRLTTAKPIIDGKLDDACWKTGTWAGNFIQFTPTEGGKPSQPTEMKILYDDKNIYVAIRAFDSEPKKIQRIAGPRDENEGDIVGINFDSYHDQRTGFEFDLTAYGQKIDLVLTNPLTWDVNWNPVWQGKVGMEDSAWTVEMEIPLNQLRYSSEDIQTWGLHCWRWINRLQEESDWERQTLTGPGVLYNFGILKGIQHLKKSPHIEIMPYALGQLNAFKKEPQNPFAYKGRSWSGKAGLDAKIGLTSNFTMDLTINPDFGQVEADPSVMNLTAYETLYQEKRPFFIEGKTIFDYDFDDINLFYSRRIGHAPAYSVTGNDSLFVKSPELTTILSAVKLSGVTAKGLSVGVLQSLTATEYATLSNDKGNKSHQVVEPLTSYTVARIQKDYHQGATILGGIFTSTNRFIHNDQLNFLSDNAYTGGLDFLHQWNNKEFFVDAKLIGSYINGNSRAITLLEESSARYYRRPGADYLHFDTSLTQLSGYGMELKIGKGAHGLWRYSTGIKLLSPGLELNDLGYMQSSDIITQVNDLSYFVVKPVSIFRSYNIGVEQFNTWNFNGDYLGSGEQLAFTSVFRNKWSFQNTILYHSRALDTRILRGGYDMKIPSNLNISGQLITDNSKNIFFQFVYDFIHDGNHSANSYQLAPGITVRPANSLNIGVTASYVGNHDELQYVNTVNGNRYILGTINQQTFNLTFRINYIITPELSIQYYGSPFVSKGHYSQFKYVVNPLARNYDQRFIFYKNPTLQNNQYELDENNDNIPDYAIANPDFNFHQLRSNLVVRWEYRPGSDIYFVWSSDVTGNADAVSNTLGKSFRQMWSAPANNIFLVKFSYWFSL